MLTALFAEALSSLLDFAIAQELDYYEFGIEKAIKYVRYEWRFFKLYVRLFIIIGGFRR
jgi:hypothetical protein